MTVPGRIPRTAWFHCFSGIAGDMALGALVDAGADLDAVLRMVELLPVGGWSVDAVPVLRNGISATQLVVKTHGDGVVRTHAHISGLLIEARLPPRVLDRALSTFRALAEAEGKLHRRPAAHVHFHEVGGIDAIVDIVGTCAALEVLGVDHVRASPIATGMGMIRSAHGLLPNPAPAVVELLRGAPVYGADVGVELTTPTGAALLAALADGFGPLPPMRIISAGYGAGTRELDSMPNVTQVVIGETVDEQEPAQDLLVLETNVDDVTGETLAHALEVTLEAGALDAWVTPVLMKKGRPAHMLSALCDIALARQVSRAIMTETGTIGLRASTVRRWAVPRRFESVEVGGHSVRIKVSPGQAKVEHADAARVARLTGLPLREVTRQAETAWHATPESTTPGSSDATPGALGTSPRRNHPAAGRPLSDDDDDDGDDDGDDDEPA